MRWTTGSRETEGLDVGVMARVVLTVGVSF
jgi:hypothetical protein